MKLLRLKPFDVVNDIYLLQEKRKFLFIPYWKTVGVGSKERCELAVADLEEQKLLKLVVGMIQDTEAQLERLK